MSDESDEGLFYVYWEDEETGQRVWSARPGKHHNGLTPDREEAHLFTSKIDAEVESWHIGPFETPGVVEAVEIEGSTRVPNHISKDKVRTKK